MNDLEVDSRVEALRRYSEARRQYEEMYDDLKGLKQRYADAEQTLIDVITNSGSSDTGSVPGVGRAILKAPALKPQVLAADRGKLAEWLKTTGHGDVLAETCLPSALADIVRGIVEQGKEVPDFIKVYYEARLAFTRED